jgi:hypothetical protein
VQFGKCYAPNRFAICFQRPFLRKQMKLCCENFDNIPNLKSLKRWETKTSRHACMQFNFASTVLYRPTVINLTATKMSSDVFDIHFQLKNSRYSYLCTLPWWNLLSGRPVFFTVQTCQVQSNPANRQKSACLSAHIKKGRKVYVFNVQVRWREIYYMIYNYLVETIRLLKITNPPHIGLRHSRASATV